MTVTTGSPLERTVAELDARSPYCDYLHSRASTPEGWTTFAEMTADGGAPIDRWLDVLHAGEACGRYDVAASYLASWLGGAVAAPLASAIAHDRRAWPIDSRQVAVRPHELGWVDGVLFHGQALWVLPDDPDAGHPDATVVADIDALRSRAAISLVALLAPVFEAIHARSYNIRGMWGAVADSVASALVDDGEAVDSAVWREIDGLVDALMCAQPQLRVRPTMQAVSWRDTTVGLPVRGTCCLWNRTQPSPDRCGEGYCTSCPKRTESSRAERWSAWLTECASA